MLLSQLNVNQGDDYVFILIMINCEVSTIDIIAIINVLQKV